MKFKEYKKRRERCHRVMNCMKWFMIIGFYRLTCVVGCIEQYHLNLKQGIGQAVHTMIVMAIALVVHQIANYIASYQEMGCEIEIKK